MDRRLSAALLPFVQQLGPLPSTGSRQLPDGFRDQLGGLSPTASREALNNPRFRRAIVDRAGVSGTLSAWPGSCSGLLWETWDPTGASGSTGAASWISTAAEATPERPRSSPPSCLAKMGDRWLEARGCSPQSRRGTCSPGQTPMARQPPGLVVANVARPVAARPTARHAWADASSRCCPFRLLSQAPEAGDDARAPGPAAGRAGSARP